jgi:hypothetical protein
MVYSGKIPCDERRLANVYCAFSGIYLLLMFCGISVACHIEKLFSFAHKSLNININIVYFYLISIVILLLGSCLSLIQRFCQLSAFESSVLLTCFILPIFGQLAIRILWFDSRIPLWTFFTIVLLKVARPG